jgi:leader peptidase (prepilin peptidase) / N-methyltransferase
MKESHLARSLYLQRRMLWMAMIVGASLAAIGVVWGPEGQIVWSTILALSLSWSSFVDIDRFILPDAITVGLVVVGLAMHLPLGAEAMLPFIAGAVLGYSILTIAALSYRQIKGRDGLGKGDAKLLAAAGAWLSWLAIPSVLLIAASLALAYLAAISLARGRFDSAQRLPFGPFLATAFWFEWVFGAGATYENALAWIGP